MHSCYFEQILSIKYNGIDNWQRYNLCTNYYFERK